MPPRDPTLWMWAEACQFLDRAERLQRRFFELGEASRQPSWEPPVDVFETETELLIEIALPGVDPQQVQAAFEAGTLLVSGERRLPVTERPTAIRRLELPYGRFERRIPLPPGRYELARRELTNGCLLLSLRKLA